jgi:hypothetical protein
MSQSLSTRFEINVMKMHKSSSFEKEKKHGRGMVWHRIEMRLRSLPFSSGDGFWLDTSLNTAVLINTKPYPMRLPKACGISFARTSNCWKSWWGKDFRGPPGSMTRMRLQIWRIGL